MKHILFCFAILVLGSSHLNCSSGVNVPANAALLSWDANTESDLAGYKLHYGTAPGSYDQVVDAGATDQPSAPSFLVTDLASGTTYYFVVTAYDTSANESETSDEVSKTIH